MNKIKSYYSTIHIQKLLDFYYSLYYWNNGFILSKLYLSSALYIKRAVEIFESCFTNLLCLLSTDSKLLTKLYKFYDLSK